MVHIGAQTWGAWSAACDQALGETLNVIPIDESVVIQVARRALTVATAVARMQRCCAISRHRGCGREIGCIVVCVGASAAYSNCRSGTCERGCGRRPLVTV